MTNAKATVSARQFNDSPQLFTAYLPLKQHSEPEDGAIEEEGTLEEGLILHGEVQEMGDVHADDTAQSL
ncbi:MAG: hypothetical protein EOO01_41145 [Chitinophagaceae bacterium]|nr:MAG: hypothetical protein EOO01_41145 [Chitinophagaceae bacterium]